MRFRLRQLLRHAVDLTCQELGHPLPADFSPILEVQENEKFGDFSSNAALVLAKPLRTKPRDLASHMAQVIDREIDQQADENGTPALLESTQVAGPGFLNFKISRHAWFEELRRILDAGDLHGRGELGQGKRVQVEFVSANPTGPLHVGHGRSAAVGDVLANLLDFSGYAVDREYYVNDAGAQMTMLGRSTYLRYRELHGQEVDFPEDGYQGDYVRALAEEIKERHGAKLLEIEAAEAVKTCRQEAGTAILDGIRSDLEDFGVTFDSWFSEQSLYDSTAIEKAIQKIKDAGYLYQKEGAWWLQSSAFADDEDRVVVRADGRPTYLASDIAYHHDKFERGYTMLIDVWGSDHHGYVPRVKAALEALGYAPERLRIPLVQFVNLVRGKEKISMSTRSGSFITLAEVVQEVGRDAARFFFLLRRCDAHLDFDLDLAKEQSSENPVYYVQYAHARIWSIFAKETEIGFQRLPREEVDFSVLRLPQEIKLVKRLAAFPSVVENAAVSLEPHRLTFYVLDLVGEFHRYYNSQRVLEEDPQVSSARLYLLEAVRCVVSSILGILGVAAPKSM